MAVVLRVLGQYDGKEFTRANADLVKMAKSGEGVSSSLASISLKAQKLGAGLMGVGKSMTTGITLPIVGIGIAAIAVQKDFEVAMNQIGVASGATASQMENLSALAKQMGADTAFSANEAAQAMLELAKGGITPAQIEAGALSATMNLAASDGLELADSATIVTNAMNMFSLSAADATVIADALAGGANASSAGVASLAEGLGNVGPAAAAVGMSLQDTVGVLAAFDQAGMKGAEGGTMFKSMLIKMVAPTSAAQKVMDKYGLSFVDASGNMKSAAEVAQMMQDKLGGLDEATRGAALAQIFGTRAVLGALEMTKLGAAGIEEYTAATHELGGAQEMADARMKGTAGAIEQLMGSLETLALSIGETIAPAFVTVANFLKGIADALGSVSPGVRTLAVIIAALAAAFGPLILIIAATVNAFATLTAAMARVAAASPRVAAGMTAVRSAASLMAGPIGLAVAALTFFIIDAGNAKAAAEGLAGTFDEVTGAATKLSRAKIGEEFLKNFSAEELAQTPFTLNEITDAVLAGGDAYAQLKAQVEEYSRTTLLSNPGQMLFLSALGNSIDAAYRDATAAKTMAEATAEAGKQAETAAAEKRGMTSATVASAIAAGNAVKPTTDLADSIAGVGDEADTTTDKLQALNDYITGVQTVMDYEAAWDDLRATIKENGKTLDEHTKKGRENLSAINEFASATAEAALQQFTLTGDVNTAKEALGNLGTLFNTTKMSDEAKAALLGPFQALIDSLADNGVEVAALQRMLDNLQGKTIPITVVTKYSYIGTPPPGGYSYDSNGDGKPGAIGGLVTGPGGPTQDLVPRMLSNGEFIIRAASVRKFGVDFMSSINRGVNPLESMPVATAASAGSSGVTINGGITVQSAAGERAEISLPRALRRMAFLAGMNG